MTNKNMEKTKLPNGELIYTLALLSCTLFCFGGITIVFALISYILARKSEKIYWKQKGGSLFRRWST